MRRFNAYRQHTLREDLTTPFTSEDLLRFFDSIIGKNVIITRRGYCHV